MDYGTTKKIIFHIILNYILWDVAKIVSSHDITAAILVSQNNKMVAMLVSQTNPVGV